MRLLLLCAGMLLLFGCSSNDTPEAASASGPQVANEFQRFAPRYPVEEARAGREGCATVRYLLTPSLLVEQVEVLDATSRHFANESAAVVPRWNWQSLGADRVAEPTWFETRFEFCLETGRGNCSPEQLQQRTTCRGDDVVSSVGYRVR
ncbi:energy transducer TonB [Alkalimonas sp. MEB108]|uniref:Energy transducer TonB n=1 Tax=Alkalimonas cellulosilytica TaxID=3058395 RepID=A0ABU7J7S6_9GAMM|nr:energy transducer TonB [Alkalimonas sp. MEB108]MEE2002559.1 energy transducer TonB [Alkalimonas sp. MEB108]